ncbi:MAG TPA: isochorismatase family cysteine hydrolase [Candidatus Eremiobacteraceae bacterium]|nr:isochorismatase family cysteine hydrolase [Candidatus Eremiobacteraceae bacterium]
MSRTTPDISTADLAKSAVVVIDLANDFVYPGGMIADAGGADYQKLAQGIIPRLSRLLDAARSAGATVIYTTDAHTLDDFELRKWPPHAMAGTRQAEIVTELAPKPGDVVLGKRTYSPFCSSSIDEVLRERGITRLYITGLHTDCCARHTSGDAFQRGYDLVWVTDVLTAFTGEAHAAGLEYFKAWYASDPERQFRTVDDIIADWSATREPATAGPR